MFVSDCAALPKGVVEKSLGFFADSPNQNGPWRTHGIQRQDPISLLLGREGVFYQKDLGAWWLYDTNRLVARACEAHYPPRLRLTTNPEHAHLPPCQRRKDGGALGNLHPCDVGFRCYRAGVRPTDWARTR